jgi:lipopolysaccharide transport system permease protein
MLTVSEQHLNGRLQTEEAAPTAPDAALPEQPVIRIRPDAGSSGGLREMWAYRELLWFLAWRDIQLRYRQTALGVAWAVIQPLFTMLLFTLFFGTLAAVPSDGVPYPLFAYAGLLAWTFFANAVTAAGNSLVGSAHLITKVYFPRLIVPTAAVLAGLVDFAVASVLFAGLAIYYRIAPSWWILLLPVLVLLLLLLALAVGLWMAALNVRYRDVRHALPFAIQLCLFATPVIYPASLVPERWRWIPALNPMSGLIEAFRAVLFGRTPNWNTLSVAVVVTLGLLVLSVGYFRRQESDFADVV